MSRRVIKRRRTKTKEVTKMLERVGKINWKLFFK